jgi:hypothetical protein
MLFGRRGIIPLWAGRRLVRLQNDFPVVVESKRIQGNL